MRNERNETVITAPIARTVTLDLMDYSWGRQERIVEETVPQGKSQVADFVKTVFPNQAIEHLGRSSMLKFGLYQTPSSLFFKAVHKAYAGHHALGLRPEVLMYLVNSVIAETVKQNPEDYQDLFASNKRKETIEVRHDGLRNEDPDSPWHEAIAIFDKALRGRMPTAIMKYMLPGFTTETDESAIASLLAFMDAASPFYDYVVRTLCGIPRIVLFGEPADYRRLLNASAELSPYFQKHLQSYFDNLLPVLEVIANTAEGGMIDQCFWSQLYKHRSGSGGDCFSGWVSSFLWYVHTLNFKEETNPLKTKEKRLYDWRKIEYGGISSGSEPSHVSSVPFMWNYFNTPIPMHFIGGVLGVDIEDGAITPCLSYGVLNRAE